MYRARRRTAQFSRDVNHHRCGSFASPAYTRTYKRWPFVLAFHAGDLRFGTYVTNPRWSAWLCERTDLVYLQMYSGYQRGKCLNSGRTCETCRLFDIGETLEVSTYRIYTGVSRDALGLCISCLYFHTTHTCLLVQFIVVIYITRTHGFLINVSQSYNLLKLTKV